MPGMMEKFKKFLTGGEYEDYEEPVDEYGAYADENEYVEEPVEDTSWAFQNYEAAPYQEEPQIKATPVYQQPTSTVVMLSPSDIRTSQIVCDHIREGHIVICNLTGSSNNQRIVDYISGAVYALDGKIEPTAVKTTFVCTPKSVNLIVNPEEVAGSVSGTKVSAL